MEAALRGFYEFHECLVEPWDGPAALAFSDGVFVGSALDRNGLRPCRYKITRDGLVVAGSETGLVDLNPGDVVESGRLGPGELLVVDTRRKAILRNAEAKREVARRRPYSRWAARGIRLLRATAAVPDAPPASEPERVARQIAFGWSFEDLRYVLEPMGSAGQDAVWSMGDDTPIPPLARIPPGLYAYLRQRFAQVTNPAIDPLRETLVMTLRMHIGRRGSLLAGRAPARAERAPRPSRGGDRGAAHGRGRAGRYPRHDLERLRRRRGRGGTRRVAHRARRAVSVRRQCGAGGGTDRDSQRPGRRSRARPTPHAPGRRGGAPAPARARPANPPRPHRRSGRRVGRPPFRGPDRLRGGSGAPVARARVGAGASRGGRREPPVPRCGRGRSPQDPVEDGDLDALVLLRRPDLRGTGARGRGDRPLLYGQ